MGVYVYRPVIGNKYSVYQVTTFKTLALRGDVIARLIQVTYCLAIDKNTV
jgi:hypothetical protein